MGKLNKKTYVDDAEKVISKLRRRENRRTGEKEIELTTSKIRNLLSMVSVIYNEAVHEKQDSLNEELQGRVQYLRLRIIYEAGRDIIVRDFVEKAQLVELIKQIGDSKEELVLFCKYMEALTAYHKYYGGKD